MIDNFDFTYNVISVNLEIGTIEINYIPDNQDLTPVMLNQFLIPKNYTEILDIDGNLVYNSQEEVPIEVHVKNTAAVSAPFLQWRRQALMLDNYDYIMSANGHIQANTLNVSF